MNDELQPTGLDESTPDDSVMPAVAGTPVTFSFEARVEDILLAARVIDNKNRVDMRRNLQSLGIMLILWMFIPDLLKNPGQITNWIMVVLALALGVLLWKYPDYSNRKFATIKAAQEAATSLSVDANGITILGEGGCVISYDEVVGIYDYKNVIVVNYKRNHILTIPKDQLSEETGTALRAVFGERRIDVSPFKEPGEKKEQPKKPS